MNIPRLRETLIRDEGERLKPYLDCCGRYWRECDCEKKGTLTIGVGRNLDDPGINHIESLAMLDNDIERIKEELFETLPWSAYLNDARLGALINLGMMGVRKMVRANPKMLAAMSAGKYELAAAELLAVVPVDLRVGPAGTGAPHPPEVLRAGQADDPLARHPDPQPVLDRLLVLRQPELRVARVDGHPDALPVEAQVLLPDEAGLPVGRADGEHMAFRLREPGQDHPAAPAASECRAVVIPRYRRYRAMPVVIMVQSEFVAALSTKWTPARQRRSRRSGRDYTGDVDVSTLRRIRGSSALLVAIDSVNPSLVAGAAGERQIADAIAAHLRRIGLDVTLQEAAPGRPNVIGVLEGRAPGRSLMFCGHIDTVGVEGMMAPFDPQIRDGRLYGRGSQDMKGGVAAMVDAARALADGGLATGRLIVAAVVDEEFASLGADALAAAWSADAAVVTEPTDLQVAIGHKGFAWLDVETAGRAAHGSRPADGRDAILRMGRVLHRLDALDRTLQARPPQID